MMLDYFYGQSGELFAYFRIPKALFQDSRFRQLSTDARTLYGILLDRMSLSAKNSWVDEHGRVYIIYTVREVQESLCCAEHKAVKLFRELEQADLIERKRRGLGRPSLIYVKNFSSGLPKAQIQNCANSNSCAAESAVQVRPKSQSNKTDPFTNHPFKVVDDEAMTRTVESIAQFGVLAPLIARPRPDGDGYEIISGHRRQFAAKMAGLETLPVIVRDMDDDAPNQRSSVMAWNCKGGQLSRTTIYLKS